MSFMQSKLKNKKIKKIKKVQMGVGGWEYDSLEPKPTLKGHSGMYVFSVRFSHRNIRIDSFLLNESHFIKIQENFTYPIPLHDI